MKRRISVLLKVFLSVCTVLPTAACSVANAEVTPKAVAIVIGNHANSKGLNFGNAAVRELVSEAIMSEGYVSVISVDGDPEIISGIDFTMPDIYKNGNHAKLKDDAMKSTNALLNDLLLVAADDPEVDTLKALQLAVRSFSDLPEGTEKTILVLDTGLSTAGVLDFNNNLLSADPGLIADELDRMKSIPDFSGINVLWRQIGDTEYPQKPLSDAQKDQLKQIWKQIIEKTGGYCDIKDAPYTDQSNDSLPPVTTVELPDEIPVAFDSESLMYDADFFKHPQILSEEQVKFVADSDQYLDAQSALEVITPIADFLKQNSDVNLLLIGTTAGDIDNDFTRDLSLRRANAVKTSLIDLGISPERITTRGLGSHDPWHVFGAGTTGTLAAQNRKVVILDLNSEDAKKIIGSVADAKDKSMII